MYALDQRIGREDVECPPLGPHHGRVVARPDEEVGRR
jgi:hypothetical protein